LREHRRPQPASLRRVRGLPAAARRDRLEDRGPGPRPRGQVRDRQHPHEQLGERHAVAHASRFTGCSTAESATPSLTERYSSRPRLAGCSSAQRPSDPDDSTSGARCSGRRSSPSASAASPSPARPTGWIRSSTEARSPWLSACRATYGDLRSEGLADRSLDHPGERTCLTPSWEERGSGAPSRPERRRTAPRRLRAWRTTLRRPCAAPASRRPC